MPPPFVAILVVIGRRLLAAWASIRRVLPAIHVARRPRDLPVGSFVLFPIQAGRLACGIAGILEIVEAPVEAAPPEALLLEAQKLIDTPVAPAMAQEPDIPEKAIQAARTLDLLTRGQRALPAFPALFRNGRETLEAAAALLSRAVLLQDRAFADHEAELSSSGVERVNAFLTELRDIGWRISGEMLPAMARVAGLVGEGATDKLLVEMRKIDAVLHAIDRMEIRGRDSAGVSILVHEPRAESGPALSEALRPHQDDLAARLRRPDLLSGAVRRGNARALFFVYKVAREIGSLGDNAAVLRAEIARDLLLAAALEAPGCRVQVLGHTRWASNGVISQANAHPVDNERLDGKSGAAYGSQGQFQVVLNGDIDNYQELRARLEESRGARIRPTVTTDAKIIGLSVESQILDGRPLDEAFRLACREFTGSSAIALHSDLAPGRFLLSLKGSGQALYVTRAPDHFFFASETYGFVEHSSQYIKLEGNGGGEVASLSDTGELQSRRHDGTPLPQEGRERQTEITTRDIDRRGYPHFFLKEIHEAPESIRRTLRGRLVCGDGKFRINLGEEILPRRIREGLLSGEIGRIFLIGQGTASVAGMAIARALASDLAQTSIHVEALKASELSGWATLRAAESGLPQRVAEQSLRGSLVIAVTQSGTTTDTNRAVDLARAQGAHTLAIVNRRGSDVTDKVDGVLYTSDGRDIEMAVASTKAFYAQVAAGMLLSLGIASLLGADSPESLERKARSLAKLPDHLTRCLSLCPEIACAAEIATARKHWAVVGSGPIAVAAQEVRIKLSELCYKSVACDTVEDKKHIDLSAEPLIIVCAAGSPESVLQDIVKDVAIFQAHKAATFVIASEDEERFTPYADAQVRVPKARPEISLILNTLVGHIFGYHIALAIARSATLLCRIRSSIVAALEEGGGNGASSLGLLRPSKKRELDALACELLRRIRRGVYRAALNPETAAEVGLLLKYATGRLSLASFSEEFEAPPDPGAVVGALLSALKNGVDELSRPIDAIKHQAKTVTVGTSRPSALPEGVIFDALREIGTTLNDLDYRTAGTLQMIQPALKAVAGWTRYEIHGLSDEGLLCGETGIRVIERRGVASGIPSRVERSRALKGTKRTIVQQGKVLVTVGRHDGREIAIVPILDENRHVKELALLHLAFQDTLPLQQKLQILEPCIEEIRNAVVEQDVPWDDRYLEGLSPRTLLLFSPERVVELIVAQQG